MRSIILIFLLICICQGLYTQDFKLCYGLLTINADEGTISSNKALSQYDNNMDCTWVINFQSPQLQYRIIEITSNTEANWDFLQFTTTIGGTNVTKTWSGHFSTSFSTFNSSSYIRFTSDSNIYMSGFNLSWYSLASLDNVLLNTSFVRSITASDGNTTGLADGYANCSTPDDGWRGDYSFPMNHSIYFWFDEGFIPSYYSVLSDGLCIITTTHLFEFYGSVDNSSWTLLDTYFRDYIPFNSFRLLSLSRRYQYYKMVFPNDVLSISEIEIGKGGYTLLPGDNLNAGDFLTSRNSLYQAIYQADGSFMIYYDSYSSLLSSPTLIYLNPSLFLDNKTTSTTFSKITLTDEGNLFVYNTQNIVIWTATPVIIPSIPTPNPAWQCILGLRRAIRRNLEGNIECYSRDGRTCVTSSVSCQSINLDYKTVPLTCGLAYNEIYGYLGYDSYGHWCHRSNNYLVYPCSLDGSDPYCAVIINEYSIIGDDRLAYIELYNRGSVDIDLEGWSISDIPIPNYIIHNKTIPAFGYTIIHQFEHGISWYGYGYIFLISPNNTVVHSALIPAEGFLTGTLELQDQRKTFQTMKYPTPGKANFYPQVGPLVFREILFYQCVLEPYVMIQSLVTGRYFANLNLVVEYYADGSTLSKLIYPISSSFLALAKPLIVSRNGIKLVPWLGTGYEYITVSNFTLPSPDPTSTVGVAWTLKLIWYGLQLDKFEYDPAFYKLTPCDTLIKFSPYAVADDPKSWVTGNMFDFGRVKCKTDLDCPVTECIATQCISNVCNYRFKSEYTYCGDVYKTYSDSLSLPRVTRTGYLTDNFYKVFGTFNKTFTLQPPLTRSFTLHFSEFNSIQMNIYNNQTGDLLYAFSNSLPSDVSLNGLLMNVSAITIVSYPNQNYIDTGFSLYYDTENNCDVDNNICEQVCNVNPTKTISCSCYFGYDLDVDGVSCKYTPAQPGYARLIENKNFCNFQQTNISDHLVAGEADEPIDPKLLGCFSPSAILDLYKSTSTPTLDLDKCSFFCSSSIYFGVMNGTECACFDSIITTNPKSTCNVPCPLDKSQNCGGQNSYSVWKNPDCNIYLTPLATNRIGALWFKDTIPVTNQFYIHFDFKTNNPDGGEGFVLILQNFMAPSSNLVSGTGGGLGYDFGHTVLAVEFDSDSNTAYFDPSSKHISIQTNVHSSSIVYNDTVNWDDTNIHKAVVHYANNTFSVLIDDLLILETDIDLLDMFKSPLYFGFTSSTGGLVNRYIIGSVVVDVECSSGFVPNGTHCSDINECAILPKLCDQLCNNTPGSYDCYCHYGYFMNSDQKCEEYCGDSVIVGNEQCDSGVECLLNCTCNTGYKYVNGSYGFSPSSTHCVDIDECAILPKICDQLCNNTEGSYYCYCSHGFTMNANEKCEAFCGDGIVAGKEECDSGDGCLSNCTCETGYTSANAYYCQDIDECAILPPLCNQLCNNTVGSYSCHCQSGYVMNSNQICEARCGDGIVVGTEECDSGEGCLPNCTCSTGYSAVNKPNCQDIDECITDTLCPKQYGRCVNLPGAFKCVCDIGYYLNHSNCLAKECIFTTWSTWSPCSISTCEIKQNRTRTVNTTASEGSPLCVVGYSSISTILNERDCIYSCPSLLTDVISATGFLEREWKSKDILRDIFKNYSLPLTYTMTFSGNTITIVFTIHSSKRGLPSCLSPSIDTAKSLILKDVTEKLPNISPSKISFLDLPSELNDTCTVQLTIEPTIITSFPLTETLLAVIGGVVLIVIIGLILSWCQQIRNMEVIPNELSWPFVDAKKDIFGLSWKTKNEGTLSFFKKLPRNGAEYQRVSNFFYNYLRGETIEHTNVWAVYNKTLISRFYKEFNLWNERIKTAQIFQKKNWLDDENNTELRKWVFAKFEERVNEFDWNKTDTVPIIPVVHGTTLDKAFKICNTGFAILNTLDEGYYGQGVYFTSYANYGLQYAIGAEPAIIIAYIQPGNPYPVIEHPKVKHSLSGKAIKTGHQSHYVRVVRYTGHPVVAPLDDTVDEIVIGQESFIVPAFILQISATSLLNIQKELSKLEREHEGDNDRDRRETKDLRELRDGKEIEASDSQEGKYVEM